MKKFNWWYLLLLLPFAVLRYYFVFNIFICGLLSVIYMILVTSVELKLDIAIVENSTICNLLRRMHLSFAAKLLEHKTQ